MLFDDEFVEEALPSRVVSGATIDREPQLCRQIGNKTLLIKFVSLFIIFTNN